MKDKFITIFKKIPFLYSWAKFFYWKGKNLQSNLLGTVIYERYWQKRHLFKKSDWNKNEDWLIGYWNSKSHPHRKLLIEKISNYSPSSILEIGSNCGPNLYLIAKKFPNVKIKGIDINPMAVKMGNELLKKEGITNVELSIGKAGELNQFLDKSFDVIFTDATLIYIGPDKIKKVIKDMIRIASKALVLLEWHYENQSRDSNGLGVYHYGHWKRNYINLLQQFVPKEKINLTKINREIWPDKNWAEVGYIIEVVL